jgi:hypothetical protein
VLGTLLREGEWMKLHTRGWSAGSVLLVFWSMACTPDTRTAQERARAEVQQLGGHITVDEKSPGKPVVKVFWFRAPRVTDAALVYLREFTELRELDLLGTAITDAGLEQLQALTNLRVLCLYKTPVTDAGLAHLSRLTQLQQLDLGFTRVSNSGLAYLQGMVGLEVLDLSGTTVTDPGLASLHGLTGLRKLCLRGTQVTDTGIQDLQKALPDVLVAR